VPRPTDEEVERLRLLSGVTFTQFPPGVNPGGRFVPSTFTPGSPVTGVTFTPGVRAPADRFDHALGATAINAREWDVLYWGLYANADLPWPVGCVKVEVETKRDQRHYKPPGQHAHRTVDRGFVGAKVKIEVQLWAPWHFDAYAITYRIYSAIRPIEGSQMAIPVRHPSFSVAGVQSIVIEKLTAPLHDQRQIFKATITARQFVAKPRRVQAGRVQTVDHLATIDLSGGVNQSRLDQNQSVGPAVTPASTEGVPASGIPSPIASGL
jgi:hypothetical protein